MIKYYCDICKKEITDKHVRARLACSIIPKPSREIELYLHKECAEDFIGKDRLAQMQSEDDERKKALEERRKLRETK